MQNNITGVDVLTTTENKVYKLNGIGLQAKEIADILNSSYETAKSHMKNIKQKLGLQKDKEITAHFWCNLVGKDFDEIKKLIISSLMVLFLCLPLAQCRVREYRRCHIRVYRTAITRRNNFTA